MGYFIKSRREAIQFRDVFQHHADDVEGSRKAIIEMTYQCLQTRKPIAVFPKSLLYYGSYNLRGNKDVRATLDELAWKRSELTGKFCGCPYWSEKAKHLFDETLSGSIRERAPTVQDAWEVAAFLAKKGAEKRPKLTHEHVFPRADLVGVLRALDASLSRETLEALIERLAIGCVVLESEHCLLRSSGNALNPWLRYKGHLRLAVNPEWPVLHRQLIVNAGLV